MNPTSVTFPPRYQFFLKDAHENTKEIELPIEIVRTIFTFLDTSLLNANLVCKNWHNIASEMVWEKYCQMECLFQRKMIDNSFALIGKTYTQYQRRKLKTFFPSQTTTYDISQARYGVINNGVIWKNFLIFSFIKQNLYVYEVNAQKKVIPDTCRIIETGSIADICAWENKLFIGFFNGDISYLDENLKLVSQLKRSTPLQNDKVRALETRENGIWLLFDSGSVQFLKAPHYEEDQLYEKNNQISFYDIHGDRIAIASKFAINKVNISIHDVREKKSFSIDLEGKDIYCLHLRGEAVYYGTSCGDIFVWHYEQQQPALLFSHPDREPPLFIDAGLSKLSMGFKDGIKTLAHISHQISGQIDHLPKAFCLFKTSEGQYIGGLCAYGKLSLNQLYTLRLKCRPIPEHAYGIEYYVNGKKSWSWMPDEIITSLYFAKDVCITTFRDRKVTIIYSASSKIQNLIARTQKLAAPLCFRQRRKLPIARKCKIPFYKMIQTFVNRNLRYES